MGTRSSTRRPHALVLLAALVILSLGATAALAGAPAAPLLEPPPPNDNFANATVITSLPFSTQVYNTYATIESGEPQSCEYSVATVWYALTPTISGWYGVSTVGTQAFDVTVTIWQGNSLDALTFINCQTAATIQESFFFMGQAGQTYYVQLSTPTSTSTGELQLYLYGANGPPPNDNFANATVITSLPFDDSVDITSATTEGNEPQPCDWLSKSVWYSLTPSTNEVVQVDNSGSSFSDTAMKVYQAFGPNITDLYSVACSSWGSSLQFTALAGGTYYIQAGSIYGSSGTLHINVQQIPPPPNDNFANAAVITALPYENVESIKGATPEPNEPQPGCSWTSPTHTIWYVFTGQEDGSLTAEPSNWSFAPVIAVYTGNVLTDLTQIACQTWGRVAFHAEPGVTYYFQVANLYLNEFGSITFRLYATPPPTADFYWNPGDPNRYDSVNFCDSSYDPVSMGFTDFWWDFGDTARATGYCANHQFATDGDYTVWHKVQTTDGRTAEVTKVVPVRTHDVAITKFSVPQSASVGQTRQIVVGLRNYFYPEDVRVELYKGVQGGWFQTLGTLNQQVPVRSGNRTTDFNFSYTFTSDDAKLGKVTFRAIATLQNARDALPADNEAISLPTKVAPKK